MQVGLLYYITIIGCTSFPNFSLLLVKSMPNSLIPYTAQISLHTCIGS